LARDASVNESDDGGRVRLDRWLCAARAYRTRSVAAAACDGGKVTVNGSAAKPHKLVRPGDIVVLGGVRPRRWRVTALAERRGPAAAARLLYVDLTPPPIVSLVDVGAPRRERGSGRPTKRERRSLDRLRGPG
jgi:ribosome-associated heat shock protein Hsp15